MSPVHCPRCAKKFKNQATLLNHMNQPVSSCLTHFQEQINISNARCTSPTTTEALELADDEALHLENPPELLDFVDILNNHLPSESLPAHSSLKPPDSIQNPFRIQEHPNVAKVFGRGHTFMDQFDNDDFASARRQGHIYYPFASRDEWELASFLLRSNLSLADTDRFLKLELVSFIHYNTYSHNF
jgi:hypothetical protein